MNTSHTTSKMLGLERIQVIDGGTDDPVIDDPALLCGVDYRNKVVYLVRGEETFEIHQSDLEAVIRALTKLVE